MPLSRSNTLRTKSRSPVPPHTTNLQSELSTFNTKGTQRPFLPPSHYAAAGGYLTPGHAEPSTSYVSGETDFGDVVHRGYGKQIATFTPPTNYTRHALDTRSDLQLRSPREPTRRKVYPVAPTEGDSDGSGSVSSFPTRRREPVDSTHGLSSVEPRSRQTSPHMQRKTSRLSIAPTSSHSVHPEASSKAAKRHETPVALASSSKPIMPHANSSSPNVDKGRRSLTKQMRAQYQEPVTPRVEVVPTGPILRLPAKPALRAPVPPSAESSAPVRAKNDPLVTQHAEHSYSMNPLRTVRGLLSRKNSGAARNATPKSSDKGSVKDSSLAGSRDASKHVSNKATRNKQHTFEPDRNTRLYSPSISQPRHTDTASESGGEHRLSSSSSSSKSPHKFKSHIPRRTFGGNAHTHHETEDEASVSVDDSDLETRCELEGRNTRKLMVANGRADGSESGSLLESSSTSTSTSKSDTDTGLNNHPEYLVGEGGEADESTSLDEEMLRNLDLRAGHGVGLGVSVVRPAYPQVEDQQHDIHSRSAKRPTTTAFKGGPDSRLFGNISPTMQPSRPAISPRHPPSTPQEKTLRFSLPPSDSGVSTYSDDAVDPGAHHAVKGYRDGHISPMVTRELGEHRTKSSQYPKQSEFGAGAGVSSQRSYRTPINASRSISPVSRSSSPIYTPNTVTQYDSGDSQTDGESRVVREQSSQKKHSRRRSASVGPRRQSYAADDQDSTYRGSGKPDKSTPRVERHPPRPMSACQLSRNKSRTRERDKRPPSQAFPAHLRDMMRDRTASGSMESNRLNETFRRDEDYSGGPASDSDFPVAPQASKRQHLGYHDRQKEISSSTQHTPITTPRPKFHPPQPDLSGKDLRSNAARERLALGIPPSESDEVIDSSVPLYQGSGRDVEEGSVSGLSHAESDMSSLNQSIWQAEAEERYEQDGERLLQFISHRVEGGKVKGASRKSDLSENIVTPRLSIISPTVSGSSSCERLYEPFQPPMNTAPPPSQTRFRHTDSEKITDYALNPKLGPNTLLPTSSQETPQSREAVIQELFESEETLLRILHICVDNFILPLRVQNSSTWIAGVPSSISKLLDWFDDIVHLHEGVYAGLCAARDMQTAESERISEVLRECFILKVDVYMPYFIRVNEVLEEVAVLVGRQCVAEEGHTNNAGVGARKSDFGQFIALQERTAGCQGWTLDALLRLPLRRLEAYQSLFLKLFQLTPKNHQDYLSTFSLSRSTDVAMQVMMEVKFREDEYRLLRTFANRIRASSSLKYLPTRERRLLYSGSCLLLPPGYLSTASASCTGNRSPVTSVQRSDSLRSATSILPEQGRRNPSSSKSSWFSLLPRRKRNKSNKGSSMPLESEHLAAVPGSPSDLEENTALDGTLLHAFLFTDLILLARAHDDNADDSPWYLYEDLGILKPISFSFLQHPKVQAGTLVSMEVIVLDPENINDSAENFCRYSHRQFDMVFPPPPPESDTLSQDASHSEHLRSSLVTCRSAALKWISIPKYRDEYHPMDTNEAMSSLATGGLPLLRSPSGQFAGMRHCDPTVRHVGGDGDGDEREERGWWSLCYQRYLQELQRKEWSS